MFFKIYNILVFLDFLYLLQTLQQIFIILNYLDSIENILILFSNSFYIHEFVHSNKLLPFNIKSINSIQKYPHIIESYASVL